MTTSAPTNELELLAHARWILERNIAWISQAETKIAVVISINLGMIAALAAAYVGADSKSAWTIFFSVAYGILCILALGCAANVVTPKTSGPSKSLVFFGAICNLTASEYADELFRCTYKDLISDMSNQIHRNSEIASSKHKWVKYSIWWSFGSSGFWLCAITNLVKI